MKGIDWIAIFGALAWTPHLVGLFKTLFLKSKVRIIAEKKILIGFTTAGPILNIRLAFAAENQDIVVSDIKIRLIHHSGEERLLEWQGIKQHIVKMITPDLGEMPYEYEKEHSVLAVKLNQKDITEKYIRFQDPKFITSKRKYMKEATKKMEYLKAEKKHKLEDFLREQEMTDLYSFNKHEFSWKEGSYIVAIEMKSPEKFKVIDNILKFDLTAADIKRLEKNKDQLESDYKRIFLGTPDPEEDPWQWCWPLLVK